MNINISFVIFYNTVNILNKGDVSKHVDMSKN